MSRARTSSNANVSVSVNTKKLYCKGVESISEVFGTEADKPEPCVT